jgi:hypothetical protein
MCRRRNRVNNSTTYVCRIATTTCYLQVFQVKKLILFFAIKTRFNQPASHYYQILFDSASGKFLFKHYLYT